MTLAVLLAACSVASAAQGEAPRCQAVAEVSPQRAFVGQQIAYRLRILRRHTTGSVRWEENLAFPGFRVEWLPGSIQRPIRDAEGLADVFEERRALFPAHAGKLRIPEAGLLCNGPEGEMLAVIAATEVLAMPVPSAGRPPEWTGVVGRIDVRANLDAESARVGEAVRLSVLVHGAANVWDARIDPSESLIAQGAEVFAHPVKTARDVGRKLTLRRYAVFDLVPRTVGTLEVPELRVAWFDPESATYQVATTRRRLVSVGARVTGPDAGHSGDGFDSGAASDPAKSGKGDGRWVPLAPAGILLALLAALVFAGLVWLWRVRSGGTTSDPGREIEDLLQRAESSEQRGDLEPALADLARCARLALSRRVPQALSLSSEELFDRAGPADRELVILLQRLDRARFGGQAGASEVRDVHGSLKRALSPGAAFGAGS